MVSRFIKRISHKKGLAPGSMVHVGEHKEWSPVLRVAEYDENALEEKEISRIEEYCHERNGGRITWLSVEGLHEVKTVEAIGKCFNISPLVLEDIVNTSERPKIEDYDDYLFMVLKALRFDQDKGRVKVEQVCLVITQREVLSFQEERGGLFDSLREHLRRGKGRLRRSGADYLAYALIDTIVDNYFSVLEAIGERIEFLEDELIESPDEFARNEIYHLKRELIFLRKSVWPLREVLSGLYRQEHGLIQDSTAPYLRDTYDHTMQVIETIETFRDVLTEMLDMYMTSLSNRLNSVMKVLTMIATIFIPLTFIVGVYGMNFRVMPELEWTWGYLYVWLLMAALVTLMLVYFRRKGWL